MATGNWQPATGNPGNKQLPSPTRQHLLLPRLFAQPLQLRAHTIPLLVGQHGAHVDEHRELTLEQPPTRLAQMRGDAVDAGAIELRLIELAPQHDVRLLDLGAKVDQVARRGAEDRVEAVLLVLGQSQLAHDFGTAPPLPGRQLRERAAREGQQHRSHQESFLQDFPPLLLSTHDSHSTTAWKSFSSSDCQASWVRRSSSLERSGWRPAAD